MKSKCSGFIPAEFAELMEKWPGWVWEGWEFPEPCESRVGEGSQEFQAGMGTVLVAQGQGTERRRGEGTGNRDGTGDRVWKQG